MSHEELSMLCRGYGFPGSVTRANAGGSSGLPHDEYPAYEPALANGH